MTYVTILACISDYCPAQYGWLDGHIYVCINVIICDRPRENQPYCGEH